MTPQTDLISAPLAQWGATTVTLGHLLVASGILLALMALVAALAIWKAASARAAAAAEAAERAREAEARMAEITRAQAEMQGRLGTLAEVFSTRQAELNKAIGERLDGMTSRLGQSISEQTKATHENLARLQERLAVIDTAQSNIQSLAGQVVQLQ